MSTVQTVGFWLVYGIVVTVISGIHIYRMSKLLDSEYQRAERYKERLKKIKQK